MTPSSDTNGRGKITASTLVPLGNLLVLLGGVAGAMAWCTRIEGRVANIEKLVTELVDGKWTRNDMADFTVRFQELNPAIKVPQIGRGTK